MHPALWTSVTGLDAQNYDLKIISNNLSNLSTTGYKKSRAQFKDLFYTTATQPGAQVDLNTQNPIGIMLGSGVKITGNQKIYEQGTLERTNNELDLAIKGNGFFEIMMPDGTVAFTRDGSFNLNEQGQVVTSQGYLLNPPIGPIAQDVESLTIGNDGTITSISGNTATNLGTLTLATFVNSAGLKPIGDNLLTETPASGAPTVNNPGNAGAGLIEQGALEASNVNIVEELVRMIETQRAYEMDAKSVEAVDGMLRFLSQAL